ncbi:MAG: hypothetical protein WCY27_00630 [archaeon]|jgi:hypothetical protein|nr:hypothetical protein [archaeon]MDD2477374.1 hypothetical protein [Candidatus ainarchaeum sp.]MDD3084513.1 hypothetical protein [Candidatus ainarchaeum sp.]MDD4220794.1 hypothetical protein [Candidatus ainarchaeum sp.]MDD4662293.1 hypothetical protein [Candidatus ainarchaeum sp.]
MKKIYLDKIVNFLFPSEHNYSTDIKLNDFILDNFKHKEDSKELLVLCPPWHIGLTATRILRSKLKKENISYLEFSLHQDIISCDYKTTGKLVKKSIEIMISRIDYYKKKYNFKKIHILGISLGCLFAINVVKEIEEVDKLILSTPGHSFSRVFWFGHATRKMVEVLQANNVSLKTIQEEWKEVDGLVNISKLKNKNIIILLSKSDLIIRYEFGEKLIEELNNAKIYPRVFLNKNLGHYGTSLLLLFNPKKYIFPKF